MIGWLVVLILLAVFLFLKVGVRIQWDSNTLVLKIRVGVFRFVLSTDEKKKKAKKPKKAKKSKVKQAGPETSSQQTNNQKKEMKPMSPSLKSWIRAVLECWRELLSLVGKVLRSPTLDLLRLHLAVGGNDTEMMYGKICAALGAGLPVLYRVFRVKKEDIQVTCRYDLPKIQITAEVEATVMIYEVFALVGTVIGLLLKIYLTKKRNDKAVRTI